MKNKAKLIILHNIISPYRLPIFEELSKKYDLDVYFASLLKIILQYSKFKKKIDSSALNDHLIYTDIVGVASEVIQNNYGIIAKPRDSQALVEVIIKLFYNQKLAKK